MVRVGSILVSFVPTGRHQSIVAAMSTDYRYLGIAILAETVATTALKSAESFTRPGPSLVTVAGS